jgi:two-component system sensor histidine kinase UhpB
LGRWVGRSPLLVRLLFVNGAVVLAGAFVGTLLTKTLVEQSAFSLAVGFSILGVGLSLIINYFVLKFALRPLSSLTSTVDRVQDGLTSVRAPVALSQDPEFARLGEALNTMLDRLAVHTATIEANREQLRALSVKVITAQEEERRRIARELHDETSQSLASLLISLERIDNAIPDDFPGLKERLRSARSLTKRTLDELRSLIADLRPQLLDDLGLVPAIRWYATDRLEPEGIDVEVDIDPALPRLSPAVETALFRIAQEAISNIVKHADASQVSVRLSCDGELCLLIEDDGVGFSSDYPAADGLQHMGLFGVVERAAALGGEASIESTAGQGTRLSVSVPLDRLSIDHGHEDTNIVG